MKKILRPLILSVISIGIVYLYLSYGAADAFIIWHLRVPRLMLTLLAGMSLAAIGSVYQLMLANPLAEPYILGISSGAAFGSILLGVMGAVVFMPLGGFAGAIVTMLAVWSLASKDGQFDKSRLLISGIIAGMFFSAGISLIMYLHHEDSLIILGTLMGNLGRIFSFMEWRVFLGLFFVSLGLLFMLYRRSLILDIMSSGDNYAASVGIDTKAIRREIFVVSSLLIGISVAFAGIIGFVGLIIPHIVRMMGKGNQRQNFVHCLWLGGIFLLLCDLIAKNISTLELPVGIITAAIGCPFFIWLLLKK